MKKILFFLFIFYSVQNNAQTHLFIGELRFIKGSYDQWLPPYYNTAIPHILFAENYDIKVFIERAKSEKSKERIKTKLLPRETWYKGEIKKVELAIEIPDRYLGSINNGNMNLLAEIWDKATDEKVADIDKPITIYWTSDEKKDYFISPNTFKITEPIGIGAPAEVGLKLVLDFLNTALDSTSDEIPQYQYTIKDLDSILKKSTDNIVLSFFQFNEFSKLLIFLEPYVSERSFVNQEAKELYRNIQDLQKELQRISIQKKDSDSIYKGISYRISNQYKLFSNYQITIIRIRKYYSQLQQVLYGIKYNYKLQEIITPSIPIKYDTYNSSELVDRRLTLALGSSFLYGLRPLYNVTLSDSNHIVQFESVSRFHAVLSGGLFWSPKLYDKTPNTSETKIDSFSNKGNLSIGLLVTYSIIPNSSQIPSTNPLGLGLAIGYKKQKMGFYFTGNLKLVKQPRQYFIDQYKDNNFSLNSLDINNSRIFINKTELALGVTLMYFFNNRNTRENYSTVFWR